MNRRRRFAGGVLRAVAIAARASRCTPRTSVLLETAGVELPAGVQISGRARGEAPRLDLAARLEEALGPMPLSRHRFELLGP